MTPNDICVVVPVLNESSTIVAALESVREAGRVIVVDGGSTDQTLELAATFANVTILHSQPGRGVQLACGAQTCEHPVLLILHGDCKLSTGALQKAASAVATGADWGAMKQHINAPEFGYRLLEFGNGLRVRLRGMPFGDQAMFVRTSLYREVGGFERIPLMEDLRLSKRLRKRRWPVLINAKVYVDARRWAKRGIMRQTIKNQIIQWLHATGCSPERLSRLYRK